MTLRTVDDVIDSLMVHARGRLPVPAYSRQSGPKISLSLKSFDRHMTDEGHQLQLGWESCGVEPWGRGYPGRDRSNVDEILFFAKPAVCIVQDRREWDQSRDGCLDRHSGFRNVRALRDREDIFRVTVCKDAHQDAWWTKKTHGQIDAHAWLIYYHPRIVCHLASWIRPEHCIRIYHSVDRFAVPEFSMNDRRGILLSGAMNSEVYPLRSALRSYWRMRGHEKPGITYRKHPGYRAEGSHTPQFLQDLSKFKVSICTSSIYGYALRKIIESVASGCVVVTDLPVDDTLPEIDAALVRIPHNSSPPGVFALCRHLEAEYDESEREYFSRKAIDFYDWRASGIRQVAAIDEMRGSQWQKEKLSQ